MWAGYCEELNKSAIAYTIYNYTLHVGWNGLRVVRLCVWQSLGFSLVPFKTREKPSDFLY